MWTAIGATVWATLMAPLLLALQIKLRASANAAYGEWSQTPRTHPERDRRRRHYRWLLRWEDRVRWVLVFSLAIGILGAIALTAGL